MNLFLSRRAAFGLVLFAVVSVGLFAFFSSRFGGPGVSTSDPLEVHATMRDAEGIGADADVLVRGVKVGKVGDVKARGDRTRVTLELDGRPSWLHSDASIRIGTKTPLGEPFVDLDPGRAAGAAPPDGAAIGVRPAVEIDEALQALDAPARADLKSLLRSNARGLRSPAAAERVSGTVAGLSAVVDQLHSLSRTLHGQEGDIAASVQDGRKLLAALAGRDASVRRLVADADTTLTAVAGQRSGLSAGLAELPTLVTQAGATLRAARPLVAEARTPVRDLRSASGPLGSALRAAPAPLADLGVVLERAEALRAAAAPALAQLDRLVPVAEPAVRVLGPALANLVPMLGYLAPRSRTIVAWFSNTADLGVNGDSKGKWARFFIGIDPSSAAGLPGAPPHNSYTQPGDAAHNQPYKPGDYPRLMPYVPALKGTGKVG